MEHLEKAEEILDTMLGYLGFVVHIDAENSENGPSLQIHSQEAELLIGRRGDRLDDIQYLVNRILQLKDRSAPRVRIDVEHYRAMREDGLIERVQGLAEKVRATGKPVTLNPMNSYNRRIVHNAFKDDPDIETSSPPERGRVKRITLRRRRPS